MRVVWGIKEDVGSKVGQARAAAIVRVLGALLRVPFVLRPEC